MNGSKNIKAVSSPLLNATEALQLITPLFGDEWAKTDADSIQIKQLMDGMMNTLHLITRSSPGLIEPTAVLVRHFGPPGKLEEPAGSNVSLSSAQQAVVYWEMSHRGWGPKIYGLFPGGRVEEYIDSHTLTAEESAKPDIRRDVARSYARLHSLRFPLPKDRFLGVIRELSEKAKSKHEEVARTLLAVDDPVGREYADIFQTTDWSRELEWVIGLFEKHRCKMTAIHVDANYLNLLVKNCEDDCRVVLIDYETMTYGYRGFDIGGHFNERMYCYNKPDTQLTGHPAPDIEEQRSFCTSYLEESKILGEELTEYDTVEHLLLEAKIGRLCQLLFTNLLCTVFDDEVEVEPLFLSGLVHMMKTYRQLRVDFAELLC